MAAKEHKAVYPQPNKINPPRRTSHELVPRFGIIDKIITNKIIRSAL